MTVEELINVLSMMPKDRMVLDLELRSINTMRVDKLLDGTRVVILEHSEEVKDY